MPAMSMPPVPPVPHSVRNDFEEDAFGEDQNGDYGAYGTDTGPAPTQRRMRRQLGDMGQGLFQESKGGVINVETGEFIPDGPPRSPRGYA